MPGVEDEEVDGSAVGVAMPMALITTVQKRPDQDVLVGMCLWWAGCDY